MDGKYFSKLTPTSAPAILVSKEIYPSSKIALSFHCNHLDFVFPGAKTLRYTDEEGRLRSMLVLEGVFENAVPTGLARRRSLRSSWEFFHTSPYYTAHTSSTPAEPTW